jgi:hypothetical protein
MKTLTYPGVRVHDRLGIQLSSKGLRIFLLAVLFASTATTLEAHARKSSGFFSSGSSVRVRGYTKKSGRYVAPDMRSEKNHSKSDNWSTKGNVNPYTGKPGTRDP